MDYNEKEPNTEQDLSSADSGIPEAEESARDYEQVYEQDTQSSVREEPDIAAYKENLKQMKQQYKTMKREEKRRQQEACAEAFDQGPSEAPVKRGMSLSNTIIISLVTSVLIAALLLFFLLLFPSPSKSVLGRYFGSLNGQSGAAGELSGGTLYVPNKDVITIENEQEDFVTAVYAKAAQSIVGIRVVAVGGSMWQQSSQVISEGTGTVYSEDGLIITNYHVVEDVIKAKNLNASSGYKYEVRIYFDTTLTEYFTAEIIGGDARTDLALLKTSLTGLVPVEMADSDALTIGEPVAVMGCGGGIEFMDSINDGIISGLHRNITTETGILYDLIQTNAAINPGNSGGALLNKEGKLVGICFLKIADSAYDNMAFAIPTNTVKKIISQIEEKGSADSPYIGVIVDTTYNKTIADQYGYPLGAWVSSVTIGSPAADAGIKENDIIVKFGDTEVTNFYTLRDAISKCQIGDVVKMQVYRYSIKDYVAVDITVESNNES